MGLLQEEYPHINYGKRTEKREKEDKTVKEKKEKDVKVKEKSGETS